MKSELLPDQVYVLCLGCLIAQQVENYAEADLTMRGHAKLISSHHGLY